MKDTSALTMDAFQLKSLAILAMVLDHVGAVFFPAQILFRAAGRIAAPIMAFFIAEGYTKTRHVRRYMLRLLIFALISMLPYRGVFGGSPFSILFDLLLGLWVIDTTQWLQKDYQKWLVVFLAAGVAYGLKTDGYLGISTLVYLFYRYGKNKRKMVLAMSLLYGGGLAFKMLESLVQGQAIDLANPLLWLRLLSLLALLLIFRYNGERGKGLKYFFYIFYPAHLILLYFLKEVFSKI